MIKSRSRIRRWYIKYEVWMPDRKFPKTVPGDTCGIIEEIDGGTSYYIWHFLGEFNRKRAYKVGVAYAKKSNIKDYRITDKWM